MEYPIDIYVLHLEDDFYYVGKTHYLRRRLDQHNREGIGGSEWTKLHSPVKMIARHTFYVENEHDEDKYENRITIETMKTYGWQRVRGGYWCEVCEANTLVKLHRYGHFRSEKRKNIEFAPTKYTRFTIKLEHGKYYVGYARDLQRALRQYLSGKAPAWVVEHGYCRPIKVTEFECADGIVNLKRDVDPTVIKCFEKYGYENVRGGSFTALDDIKHHDAVSARGLL